MDEFKQTVRELLPIVDGVAAMGALVFPIVWLSASQEAAAFNRFTTGSKATTWDAVWVELRVEAQR